MWLSMLSGTVACCKDINDNKTDCNKFSLCYLLNGPRFGLLVYFNKFVTKAGYIMSLCGNLTKMSHIF